MWKELEMYHGCSTDLPPVSNHFLESVNVLVDIMRPMLPGLQVTEFRKGGLPGTVPQLPELPVTPSFPSRSPVF